MALPDSSVPHCHCVCSAIGLDNAELVVYRWFAADDERAKNVRCTRIITFMTTYTETHAHMFAFARSPLQCARKTSTSTTGIEGLCSE